MFNTSQSALYIRAMHLKFNFQRGRSNEYRYTRNLTNISSSFIFAAINVIQLNIFHNSQRYKISNIRKLQL